MNNSRLGEEIGEVITTQELTENLNWYFLTNAIMNLGNSGSPVFNSEKELIGIASAYGNEDNSAHYIIPPSTGNGVGYIISSDTILIFLLAAKDLGLINEEILYDLFSEDHIEKILNLDSSDDLFKNLEIFTDIDITSDYIQAISYLKDQKTIGGYPDGFFQRRRLSKQSRTIKNTR